MSFTAAENRTMIPWMFSPQRSSMFLVGCDTMTPAFQRSYRDRTPQLRPCKLITDLYDHYVTSF